MGKTATALVLATVMLISGSATLDAQRPNRENRENLQRQVMERFLGMFVESAGLSDDQREQFGEVVGRYMERGREHSPGDSPSTAVLHDALLLPNQVGTP